MKHPSGHKHFYGKHFSGSTTIGEKGQVVIPAEARKALNLKTGDKLLVFCMGGNMVTLAKFDQLEKMANKLDEKLQGLRAMLKTA